MSKENLFARKAISLFAALTFIFQSVAAFPFIAQADVTVDVSDTTGATTHYTVATSTDNIAISYTLPDGVATGTTPTLDALANILSGINTALTSAKANTSCSGTGSATANASATASTTINGVSVLATAKASASVNCTPDTTEGTTTATTTTPTDLSVVATKIVCDDVSMLPKWGKGGPDIASSTAVDYVASHKGCHIVPDWKFQWGYGSSVATSDAGVKDISGDFVGEADGSKGKGTETGTGYNDWKTFGPTDANGVANTKISDLAGAGSIWVREVLKSGYVPFTFDPAHQSNENATSAEMYCDNDVLNYDNYDNIAHPSLGKTYYCVAFNAQKKDVPPPAPPVCAVDVVSDATNFINVQGHLYATSTYNQNPRWTAIIPGATWIWKTFYAEHTDQDNIATFTKEFTLPSTVSVATLVVAADNSYEVSLNGTAVGSDHTEFNYFEEGKDSYDVTNLLHTATNTLVFTVKNWKGDPDPKLNPAGLLYKLHVGLHGEGCGNVPPPPPPPSSVCLLENSSSTSARVNVMPGPELSLQNIFNNAGYVLDVNADQKNDQTWFSTSSATTTIEVEFIAHYAGFPSVFGYYLDGNKNTFVPILREGQHDAYPTVPVFVSGQKVSVSIPPGHTIGFADDVQSTSTTRSFWTTEKALNTDNGVHFVTYHIGTGNYLLGLEDLPMTQADHDYNDIVVRVHVLGCDTQNPPPPKNTPPVITVIPPNPDMITVGSLFTDPGATAFDQEDGTITPSIIATGTVDTLHVGTYTISYNVKDSKGLAADTKTRTVQVVLNNAPTLTLLGDVIMSVVVGSPFTDPGATAYDQEDGTITPKIVRTGTVDANTLGSYFLVYNVKDSEGLAAPTATRTVNVINQGCTANCGGGGGSDNSRPVITLKGGNPLTVTQGTSFTDPGATAFDAEDGDITSKIVVGGSVDTSKLGDYTITYDVSDSKGLPAKEVSRTVSVVPGGGGGGGGSVPITLSIFNEKITTTSTTTVVVTWNTNQPSDSRVVYGLESQGTPGTAPFYGYQLTTATDTALVMSHSMTINGIPSAISTYFRPVSSDGVHTAIGIELTRTPAQEAPQVCYFLKEYMRLGANNNPEEVTKLQTFLRDYEGFTNLRVTGTFDITTDQAVRSFQDKYKTDVLDPWNLPGNTGYVYYTTEKKINEIYCKRVFPLTNTQLAEIASFRELINKINAQGGGVLPTLPLVGVNRAGAGTGGTVAGAATETGGAIASGASTTNNQVAESRGRIPLSDLLAMVPTVHTALSGSEEGATDTSVLEANSEGSESGAIIGTSTTKRGLAAVVNSIALRTQISSTGIYAIALFIIVALILAAILGRRYYTFRKANADD